MAVVPIISQSWDTTSYVNPTRMNNIETNISTLSKATGVEYSEGVSVADKIDTIGNVSAAASNRALEFGTYTIQTSSGAASVTGVKITTTENGRYVIIGSVLGGSVLGGRLIVYNSWNSQHLVIISPTE